MTDYDTLLKVQYGLVTDIEYFCVHEVCGVDIIKDLKAIITGKKLVIALDQATVRTGMCIMDYDTRCVLAVLDLINLGFPTKYLYFESLFDFLYNLIADEEIKCFAYEVPLEHSNNTKIRAVLNTMFEFIKGFKIRVPSLTDENMVAINSSTWRSHFLASNEYSGRRRSREAAKESARVEAAKRVPQLHRFFYRNSTPPDSCDAVGIAYGAVEEVYTASGMRRPNKTMERRNIKFTYKVVPLKSGTILDYVKTNYLDVIKERKFEVLCFNNSMTVEDNCHRYCSTSSRLGIIPIDDQKTSQELKWETGHELKRGEMYVAFCIRSSV